MAEESYRAWLNGFTIDGKIPIKEFQQIYDQAYEAKLIPTPVPAARLMDYTLTDEVYRERR